MKNKTQLIFRAVSVLLTAFVAAAMFIKGETEIAVIASVLSVMNLAAIILSLKSRR